MIVANKNPVLFALTLSDPVTGRVVAILSYEGQSFFKWFDCESSAIAEIDRYLTFLGYHKKS